MIFTCFNKWFIEQKVLEKLSIQKIDYVNFMTTPAPFSNLLWSIIIKEEDQFQVGYYSWFDGSDSLHLKAIPRRESLLEDFLPDPQVEQLIIFSKGFYELEKTSNGLIFNDLRFSTMSGWFDLEEPYIFSFFLIRVDEGVSISRIQSDGRFKKENVRKLLRRIMGNNLHSDGK